MIFSVIVPTYNSPRELDLCLCGLSRQTRMPAEVLLADDGSTQETSDLIISWTPKLGCDLQHVWQCDKGYRKARIVNEAVRRSKGDHLVFLDGDSIPHSHWLEDHMRAADGRRVLCGRRVRLGPKVSNKLDRTFVLEGNLELLAGPVCWKFLAGDTKRYLLGVRLPPWLARSFHPRPRRLMGVNYSLPRQACEEVNGYDEEWTVYGHEDRDLELRLLRAGYPFFPLLNRAVVYHVYHPVRPISEKTRALIEAQEASDCKRCERGLFQTDRFDPNR